MTAFFAMNFAYYILILALFFFTLLSILSFNKITISYKNIYSLLIVLLLFTFFCCIEGFYYKKLYDEFDQLSTAQSLHYLGKPIIISSAVIDAEATFVLESETDKRPLTYPSLLSIFHSFFGYRFTNGLVLNYIIGLIFVIALYYYLLEKSNQYLSTITTFSITCSPLFIHCSNSAGYDILNIFLIFTLIIAIENFIKNKNNKNLSLVILNFVLLLQTRPESALFILSLIVFLFIYISDIKNKKIYLPLLLLSLSVPLYIQFVSDRNYSSEGSQFGKYGMLSIKYLDFNIKEAIKYTFDLRGLYNNSVLLIALIFTTPLLLLTCLFKKRFLLRLSYSGAIPFVIVGIGIIAINGVYMVYYWSNWTDPMASRFSLPFQFFISLVCSLLIFNLIKSKYTHYIYGALYILIFIIFTGPSISKNRWNRALYTAHQEQWWGQVIESYGDEKVLFISPSAQLPILMRKSGINIEYANKNKSAIREYLKSGRFEKIIVLETIQRTIKDGKTIALQSRLDPEFVLRHIDDFKFNSNADSRISELIDVRLD